MFLVMIVLPECLDAACHSLRRMKTPVADREEHSQTEKKCGIEGLTECSFVTIDFMPGTIHWTHDSAVVGDNQTRS
jgi:hypothetical protein